MCRLSGVVLWTGPHSTCILALYSNSQNLGYLQSHLVCGFCFIRQHLDVASMCQESQATESLCSTTLLERRNYRKEPALLQISPFVTK